MKIRKKILAILLVGTTALSLAGCGTKSDAPAAGTTDVSTDKETNDTATTDTATTITVWSNNRHDSAYMEEQITQFNETNDLGIYIDYVIQTDNYTNMITMATTSGQSPDIMSIAASDGIDLKTFADAKIIQPLNSFITDDIKKVTEMDEHKYEGMNVLGDDIYWIPAGVRSSARLIYNVELLKASNVEVPTTLNELVEASAAITKAGAGKSYGVIFPGQSGPFGRWLEGIASLSGISAYDYQNGRYDFSGFKPICEGVRKMFDDGSTFPGTASMKIDPIRAQFAEGNVAFHGNASQEVGVLTEQFPMKSEWAVADLPTLDGTVKGALPITPNYGWMISSQTKNAELAWKVIEFFHSEAFLKGYFEGGYTIPISKYMAAQIDASKTGRLADFALQEYDDVYPTPPAVTPDGDMYTDALWNACLTDGPDIDETIENLNKSYNDALDKAVAMGKVQRLVMEDYNSMKPSQGTRTYLSE